MNLKKIIATLEAFKIKSLKQFGKMSTKTYNILMDKELLARGVANIIPGEKDLKKLLAANKKLNIYLGIDPTSTHIHLGHAVSLRKIQKFAEAGHNVTFLIGDFTARIGDTSDKESERPVLTAEEIRNNFKNYKKQAEKIVDFSKVNVKNNSTWLAELTFEDIIKLTQQFSLGDFASRELIKKRMEKEERVGLHEVLYPVMQGYDSYHLDTDIQIGGTDQTFNMQAGRTLQKNLRDKDSCVITTPFLLGPDGRKMSKSWGNAIWLDDTPSVIYTKIMQIDDNLIRDYFILATDIPTQEIEKMNILKDPMTHKKRLAYDVVKDLHNKKNADEAQDNFEKIIQKGELPQNIPTFNVSEQRAENASVPHLVFDAGATESVSDARRLLKQGGIEINDRKITEINMQLEDESIVRVGKRNAFMIKIVVKEK